MFFWMALGLVSDKISEQSNNNLYILILIFLISGIFLGIGGIRDYFLFHPTRLFTVFSKEIPFHMLGLYLVYFIPFSYVLFFLAKGWFKYLSLINLVFLVPCLVWHSSRAVWISVIFSLLITTLCYKKRSLILFLIIFVILYSLLCYINPISFTRIKKIFEPQDRLAIMSVAIKIFKTSPLLGSGLGMYEKLFSKYYEPPVGYEEFSYLHAHNTYLEILSEIGILGILAFLWIFLVFFKNAFKSIKNIYLDSQIILYGLIGSLIATLILAFFGSIILVGVQESSLFWFLLGLASGLISKGTVPGEINY
jgi:O-antigen ligase